ncbi:hypothetical protein CI610_02473 [invertebrate metagenome]|uniref:Uncharacterized protein n=1 Tax=invertebrate metagenome TaxID=1711999 RepID=A0A2H9T5U9_9ZZZZ
MSQNKHKTLQDLVDSYLASGLSARQYVEACVDAGDISAAEALKLLSLLKNSQAVTFKLSEVCEGDFPGLKMTLVRKADEEGGLSFPLFRIAIDESLNSKRDDVIDALQRFAKELAVIATKDEDTDAEAVDLVDESPEEWLSHPNILPASDTRH